MIGTWQTLKAACLHSLTMAWSYVLGIASFVLTNLDTIGLLVNDPQLSQQFAAAFSADPKVLGLFGLAVSAINFATRLRGIIAAPKRPSV